MDAIRILVVDDHEIVRDGLRWMLGADTGFEVTAGAETAAEAMELIRTERPHVVLLDIHLPGRSGLDALKDMRTTFPDVPVVILTMSDDPEYVEEAVRAGAVGYLVKNAPQDEIVHALRAAAAGEAYLQSEVTRPLLARFAMEVRAPRTDFALSPRELEVISLLSEGLANKQIAGKAGIAEATVKGYLRQVYEKLGAADRAQAVAIALRHRLIE